VAGQQVTDVAFQLAHLLLPKFHEFKKKLDLQAMMLSEMAFQREL
jgi:hypothetical protein